MNVSKTLIYIGLSIFLVSCGGEADTLQNDFSVEINTPNNVVKNDETLKLSVANKKQHPIDSIKYNMDGQSIAASVGLDNQKLGKHTITAEVYVKGKPYSVTTEITILSAKTPKVYGFNIVNEFPHDINAYTQGLEFHNGVLYESIGQYGKSELRKVDYKTGDILQRVKLDDNYFGEGLTIINNKLFQLTWRENTGFVYDITTLERESSFNYNQSKEGWGLCNDGTHIYKSDGTEKIWTLDPNSLAEKDYIQAYHNRGKTTELNELEWINGKIFSNRYQLNGVAIINPINGAIEGVIDFSLLSEKVTQHSNLDVLNGIAYNPETQTIFVTGKYWDKLFEVELVER